MTANELIATAAAQALTRYAAGILGNSVGTTVPPGPVGSFFAGTAVQAGVESKDAALPLVLLFDITTDQKATTDRVSRAACTLYFADAKPGQGDSAELEALAVARMSELKQRFFAALDDSPVVEITNMRATPFHDAYAAKLTGVGVQFTLGVPARSLVAACV